MCVCVLCNLDPAKDVFSPRWGQFSGKARKANTTSRFGIDVCYFCVDVCHFCVILVSCFLSRTCCFFLRHVFWRDGRKTSFQGPGVYIYIYVYIIYIYTCVYNSNYVAQKQYIYIYIAFWGGSRIPIWPVNRCECFISSGCCCLRLTATT